MALRKWHLCLVAATRLVLIFMKMMINWKPGFAVIAVVRLAYILLKKNSKISQEDGKTESPKENIP